MINMEKDTMINCTDNELMNIYINKIVAMRKQKDSEEQDDIGDLDEPEKQDTKLKRKKLKENPEIIITNFKVSISSRYHFQGYFNPYSVLLANTTSDGTDFEVVTVPMKDYLNVLLNKI